MRKLSSFILIIRLEPIYPEYENMIIRWGKEEVVEAVMKGNKTDNDDDGNNEFLY